MSLIQIKRNQLSRRMNQIPIYNVFHSSETNYEDISEIIRKDFITEIVHSILYDMIHLIETNHTFEIIDKVEEPKKKNIFKRFLHTTKKLIYN